MISRQLFRQFEYFRGNKKENKKKNVCYDICFMLSQILLYICIRYKDALSFPHLFYSTYITVLIQKLCRNFCAEKKKDRFMKNHFMKTSGDRKSDSAAWTHLPTTSPLFTAHDICIQHAPIYLNTRKTRPNLGRCCDSYSINV